MFFASIFSVALGNIGSSLLIRHGAGELGLIDSKDKSTPRALDFIANAYGVAAAARTAATTPLPRIRFLPSLAV